MLEHLRGRTTLRPEEQAREIYGDAELVGVELDPPRPTSCGGEPERPVAWMARPAEPYDSPR